MAKMLAFLMVGGFFTVILSPEPAEAVSQWTRKYGEPCSTCHAGFPRLTYYGERFKRNGYQDPDAAEPDGDARGKKQINEDLVIATINNWLGARLNVDAIRYDTDAVTLEGKRKGQLTLGNPNWLQLFVAGSIFKNVSIFIENEFLHDEFEFTWYWLGFHNIAGSDALNLQVGRVSPIDYSSYSNRLRITPALKGELARVRSSGNLGDDSVDQSRSRPGIQYYGYQGPVVWWGGISTGSKGKDPNHDINGWGGVRLEVTEAMESPFEGSSISMHGIVGTDACSSDSAGAFDAATNPCDVDQQKNDFYRLTPAINIRFGDFDIQAMGVVGHDENLTLTPTDVEGDFYGFNAVAQYAFGKIMPGIMIDWIEVDDPDGFETREVRLVTPFVRYFLRDNFQIDFYAQIDAQSKDDITHPDKDHSFLVNIRTMF
jgi:hypothetical protein